MPLWCDSSSRQDFHRECLECWNFIAYQSPALLPSPTEEALAKHLLWGTGAVRGADLPSFSPSGVGVLRSPVLYTEVPCSSLSSVVPHFKLNIPRGGGVFLRHVSCAVGSELFLFLRFEFFPFQFLKLRVYFLRISCGLCFYCSPSLSSIQL